MRNFSSNNQCAVVEELVENLVEWVVFWKAFVDDVQELSSKVSFDV